ncbi:MAG: prolipoprotein diacylglyceryl transferase [Desulfobacteraceae bacterium IS3]|nr:MAG: prolipoprotein diacylglyceryl transferase [Desulfobacteraceae bacterium IS3]
MNYELFVLCLAMILAAVFRWAFKALPRENWQIIAAMPKQKLETGEWRGENLTFYGAFTASAYIFAVAMIFILLGAISVPITAIAAIVSLVLIICIPASTIIAKVVEKKAHTFTVGGASFAGIVIAPWIAAIADLTMSIPVMPVLAAISIGYAFGEGFGRLACISFGCCYGKPLSDCPVFMQKLFEKRHFVFRGKTKKIAYSHGLDGQKIIPVQAITIILYSISGLSGVYLFLKGFYKAAYIETLAITQIWRLISEFLRADYRGHGKISAYQIMSILAVLYAIAVVFAFPNPSAYQADILNGLGYLWNPMMIILLQGLWLAVFLHTGRSKVTGSVMMFHVIQERI